MSHIRKRSMVVAGKKTSFSLEDEFWSLLKQVAASEGTTMQLIVERINQQRQLPNLSSAIRVYLLEIVRQQVMQAGASEVGQLSATA